MPNEVAIGGFHGTATFDVVVIDRNGERLQINPAEVDSVTSLVSIAGGMSVMDFLPEKIEDGAFMIRFHEDRSMTLEFTGREGRLHAKLNEADSLIKTVQGALAILRDQRTLVSGPKSSRVTIDRPEPPIERSW